MPTYSKLQPRRILATGETVTSLPKPLGKGKMCERCGPKIPPRAKPTNMKPAPPQVGMSSIKY